MKYVIASLPLLFVIAISSCNGPTTPADTTLRIVLLKPNGGETYHPGDTVPLSFEYRNSTDSVFFVSLWFSPDNGRTFDMPVLGAINTARWKGSPRKDTVWIIPTDTTAFGNYASDQAKIRVEDYTRKATLNDVSDQVFNISP
jgi:hypothetical protein